MLFNWEGKEHIEMTCCRNIACNCWAPLFFKCNGSTMTLSESLPISGRNSCLEWLLAIKLVTLGLKGFTIQTTCSHNRIN